MATNPVNANGGYTPLYGGPFGRVTPASGNTSNVSVTEDDNLNLTSSSLSSSSLSLSELDRHSHEPPINKEKVEALRKLISEGNYKVDSRRLAGNIFKHEKSLFTPG